MAVAFVTPEDMEALYDFELLVQATNYSNRAARTINQTLLQKACDTGNALIEGYLMPLGIKSTQYNDAFLQVLKTHAARFVMDFLAGTDPQIREQAKESMDWLKATSKLSPGALEHFLKPESVDELPDIRKPLPSVSFDEGYRWGVRF